MHRLQDLWEHFLSLDVKRNQVQSVRRYHHCPMQVLAFGILSTPRHNYHWRRQRIRYQQEAQKVFNFFVGWLKLEQTWLSWRWHRTFNSLEFDTFPRWLTYRKLFRKWNPSRVFSTGNSLWWVSIIPLKFNRFDKPNRKWILYDSISE